MLSNEIKATWMIGLIFAFRMLGVFMVLPVLALYLNRYPDASMALMGAALGAYGLFQALLQLPLAALSDKYGRKRIIILGLVLFALGSLIAAFATTLQGILIGRAIQGMGAIGATLLAYLSDSTRPIVRSRAMAIVGICIGGAFTLSVVLGPVLDAYWGLRGLFLTTAVLAGLGIFWVSRFSYSQVEASVTAVSLAPGALLEAIFYPQLWRLYISVFVLHAILTMSFLMLPFAVQEVLGLSKANSWQFYAPVLLVSLGCVMPLLRRADNIHQQKTGILIAVFGLLIVLPVCLSTSQPLCFIVFSLLFFVFFNYLEASLPAWVSKLAPQSRRGLILGVYSSSQFLGLFAGGSVGGIVSAYWPQSGVATLCAGLLILWGMVIIGMPGKNLSISVEQN